MILLDTNVVSELMKVEPEPRVRAWLDVQDIAVVWTSAVSIYEVRWGIERLPPGRRRTMLDAGLDAVLQRDLHGRIATLDTSAARAAAALQSNQALGAGLMDILIAGIAVARRAAVATRNVRHFIDLPVQVIDPWTPEPPYPAPISSRPIR